MGICPEIMNEVFRFSKNSVYSLRIVIQLEKAMFHSVQFGSESIDYLGTKIWDLFLEHF